METSKAKVIKALAKCALLLITVNGAFAEAFHPRVLNGAPSTDSTPWMVSLQTYNDTGNVGHVCGGTLIGPDTVLTAAHCVQDLIGTPEQMEAFIGSNRLSAPGERITVSGIIVNSAYDNLTFKNDLALVKLAQPSRVTEFPTPVTAAEMSGLTNTLLRLYGWGVIYSDIPVRPDQLQQVDLPLIDDVQCAERLGLDFDPNSMLCAGTLASGLLEDDGRDACEGDSGGPLISYIDGQPRIVGVVSWGFACGSSKVWGVYTRVATFGDWINSHPKVPPFISTEVSVLGTPVEGSTLTCDIGEWGGDEPITQTIQWIDRDDGVLTGKNSAKLRLTRKDVGRILSCSVTRSNDGGTTEASSEETIAILPNDKSRGRSKSATRTQCTGKNCVTMFSVGEQIRSARAIIMSGTAEPKVISPHYASSTAVSVRYRTNVKGTVTFRVVLKSGRTIVREARLGR